MAQIGFSTGALALGDFKSALELMATLRLRVVELSALRLGELPGLIDALPTLNLQQFSYIALHAPSCFRADEEDFVIDLLKRVPKDWQIVLHPDAIKCFEKWTDFGAQIALENMDRRKSQGRSSEELARCFDKLPDAKLCMDLAHAHQFDRTMTEAFRMLSRFSDRVCQLHISELNSAGRHFALSYNSIVAFQEIAGLIPGDIPIIIESLDPLSGEGTVDQHLSWMGQEISRALVATGRSNEFVLPAGLTEKVAAGAA